jgi:hypothetical protein
MSRSPITPSGQKRTVREIASEMTFENLAKKLKVKVKDYSEDIILLKEALLNLAEAEAHKTVKFKCGLLEFSRCEEFKDFIKVMEAECIKVNVKPSNEFYPDYVQIWIDRTNSPAVLNLEEYKHHYSNPYD